MEDRNGRKEEGRKGEGGRGRRKRVSEFQVIFFSFSKKKHQNMSLRVPFIRFASNTAFSAYVI